jgi:hypothetical protein
MKKEQSETSEKLIRVMTIRRGKPVELRVHYEKANSHGCATFRLFEIEDVNISTSTA